MRAVINTSAPRIEEEGTNTIEDLKRQMVLIEEENIKLFNERKKNIFHGRLPKIFKKKRFGGCVAN